MSDDAVADRYFTYDGRLASFDKKKRASTAGGRAVKALNWPHKSIKPASLASAGFFFSPSPDHPDNVICFLCHKGLDGWEEGDDPLHEHLNHANRCGWAQLAAIEAEIGEYHLGDPSAPEMVAARKATFAGRWPHDSKRGWKCKTKQLVDSGWKYTPTLESDDMATCVYCQLALDGWEPNDKPLDEHYKRAPNCPFFMLSSQTHGAKKSTREKGARGSKASRLSIQSSTAPSEVGSVDELTVAYDDTVLTTASTMTAGGKKPRAKKATTTKGKKGRAKKEETVEPEEPPSMAEEEATPQPSPPKPSRGKKRGSDAVEESTLTVSDAPAPKKRATRGRASKTVESSVIEPPDMEMEEHVEMKKPAAPKKGRTSKSQGGRKVSNASRASSASAASSRAETFEQFNDDEEIERQLQADLERPLTDDEDIIADSDSERFKARAKTTKNKKTASIAKSADFDMFDPEPVEADEGAVEDELKQLQAEMQVDEPVPEPEQLQIPKKGRKAGTRKASKQTKPKKTKVAAVPEPEPEIETEEVHFEPEPELLGEEPLAEQEDSLGSTDTVVRNIEPAPAKRGRGRPPKASIASVMSHDELDVVDLIDEPTDEPEAVVEKPQQPVKRPRGRPSKASLASRTSSAGEASVVSANGGPAKRGPGRPKKAETQVAAAASVMEAPKPQPRKVSRKKKAPEPTPAPVAENVEDKIFEEPSSPVVARQQAPATPPKAITKAQSAKQATVSPSPSPQSSDAENQPPSSKPSATRRVALAPIAETPKALSPPKRNIIAGLQSTTPWAAVDIDAVMGTPHPGANKENGTERLIKKGKDLTSPEKEMTVEEWVYHNAAQAERMLKRECEAMVSKFESEGARAMNVLEGLVVD